MLWFNVAFIIIITISTCKYFVIKLIAILIFSFKFLQGEELNGYGGLYVQRHPQLKIKLVDGCSLAAAVVLNRIPKGTTQVLLRGKITKVACAIASNCKQGIQVCLISKTHVIIIHSIVIELLFWEHKV